MVVVSSAVIDEQTPNRELIQRAEQDYRTMNNDMLLYAITRLLPSVSRYSWNLDININDEEASIVRNLPHFLIDSKDIEGTLGNEIDEANCEFGLNPFRYPGFAVSSI
ncbi:hypothetical protein OESDEN_24569 [Oesophagostomum dentatum]|uniref:Uncharacterized protein n=1 Tax=Oesophagostomum dentatum TaxID=61180 RepID=A0A0B1RT15_OESDE|nr:hypothetical protein OESDEN_24569 [Oesophagostomum dentatum]